MSPDFLEKIRNIIETLFVLFFSFLIMLITFCSLRVHAATVTPTGNIIVEVEGAVNDFCNQNLKIYSGNCNTLQCAIFARDDSQDIHTYDAIFYTTDVTSDFVYYSVESKTWPKNPQNDSYNVYPIKSSGMSTVVLSDGTSVRYSLGGMGNESYTILSNTPCYDPISGVNGISTNDSAKIVLEHLLVLGDIKPNNGGSIDNPDFEDTAYAFTGFTANNKMTATWTGTTERSYLQDQEVEEYVRVNYYFADKEAQDTIKQADAYPDEFATADKTLTIDVSGLKPDDENWFLRYIRITPCYRQAGLGAWGDFYHGSDVYVYFDVKGNIEKVIQKSKPTDLNKGNMVYDSSIGYLQNVIYTEQKTHDGSGRQATFKWSTLKSLPDDAQIEIVAQNFYIEWFNKKTEENFIYKEYGEDCFYSAGSYSFNANTPVWTWLKEKEIDPFSIKTQSYGSTEYYLRIVVYNDSDSLYHYGGWVKVNIKSKDTTIMPSTDVETGGFDDSSGLWNQDTASSDSYHYSTDDKGKLTGNIDVNSWEDLNMNSFTWMYRNMQSMVSSLGEFPAMVNAVFGYLPVQYITSIGVLLVAIVLLRFLGR